MNIASLYNIYLENQSITTDTRKIKDGDLYFALKGESFNGNKFAAQAIDKGASYAVIDEKEFEVEGKTILVENVLIALQQLAKHHREQLKIPVVGITGSNGKTTTKELIKSVLEQKFNVFATHGNLNNHIGVPLSLLAITKQHQVAVIEMGANHQKEIEFLCTLSKPDIGLITNIGKAHLEGFGGEEGVLKGKTELYTYLKKNNKKTLICTEEPKLMPFVYELNASTYGLNKADVCGSISQSKPKLSITFSLVNKKFKADSHLVGDYNANNIMAAVSVGNELGLMGQQIALGIQSYEPTNNRSQLITKESNRIIMDAYNANPSSVKGALENLHDTKSINKLAILGDMLELGDYSEAEHTKVVGQLSEYKIEAYLVGDEFKKVNQDLFKVFKSAKELSEHLALIDFKDYLILIKGSRGIKLETVLDSI